MTILDTNVLSELAKGSAEARVLKWFRNQSLGQLFTTAITQSEMLYGMEILPNRRRRASLELQLEQMFSVDFEGRILPFDSQAAEVYAPLFASRRALGRPISQSDAQIA